MSQVKNLRAMFEQRGDSSPPERGRSSQASDSPRPLSRVRTSFVTVEKDGRVGLQRDPSSDSTPTLSRTISAGTEGDTAVPAALPAALFAPVTSSSDAARDKIDEAKPPVVAQTPKRPPVPVPEEPAPVTPTKDVLSPVAALKLAPAAPAATPKALAEVKVSAPTPVLSVKGQDGGPGAETTGSKTAHGEKSPARRLFVKAPSKSDGEPLSSAPKKTLEPPPTNGATIGSTSLPLSRPLASTTSGPNGVSKDTAQGGPGSSLKAPHLPSATTSTSIPLRMKVASVGSTSNTGKDATPKTTTAPNTGRPSVPKAIATSKANAKPAAKSPSAGLKTPTSPAKPLTPKLAGKAPDKKVQATAAKPVPAAVHKQPSPAAAATAAKAGAKPTSQSQPATKKPPAIHTFPPNGVGFVKPKPKSPTRPVQLPSSLTTHTASSATKTRHSLSRQSGNLLTAHQPVVRSASRTSVSTVGTAAPGARPLRRQSSTVGRPRPSIGPPPKPPARDHPLTKREKEVDESFLARMMRPTQASASKTAEKIHLSPPRKQQPAAAARKHVAPRDGPGVTAKQNATTTDPVKKVVPKASALEHVPARAATPSTATAAEPIVESASAAENVVDEDGKPETESADLASELDDEHPEETEEAAEVVGITEPAEAAEVEADEAEATEATEAAVTEAVATYAEVAEAEAEAQAVEADTAESGGDNTEAVEAVPVGAEIVKEDEALAAEDGAVGGEKGDANEAAPELVSEALAEPENGSDGPRKGIPSVDVSEMDEAPAVVDGLASLGDKDIPKAGSED